ncbi:putative aromatic-L-amino-acid decarboxylase [Rosellinia necatrix]|uniref:Putative aromatic-L-amino-acid decarboxylase n=1 Tax=Rosellinia necatrix TaxID=77044 RepID=A0A1S8A5G3_ROSNE|nr:putative aromatic-L-amino-acid decarboxylase [Rosellinia necatrix]
MLLDMMRLDKRRRGAMPHGEDAPDDGARQEDLAAGQHVVVRLLGELVRLQDGRGVALAPEPEHGEGEARARDDLEQVGPGAQQGGERLGEADVPADVGPQAADAVGADDEPDLEAAEAAAEGDLPVAVVGDEAAVGVGVLEDGEAHAQGVGQPGAVAHVQQAAVEVDEQPLVHVDVVAVEAREHGRQVLVLGAHERGAGVGRVHVHPDLALAGALLLGRQGGGGRDLVEDVGDAVEVVDGAGVGGAEGGREVEDLEPARAQARDGAAQLGARHPVPVGGVDGDGAEPDAGDLRGLLRRRVRGGAAEGDEPRAPQRHGVLALLVVGDVRRRLAQVLVPRGDHDGRDGLGRRAVDHAAAPRRAGREVAGRQGEGPRQPVEHDGLELRHHGRADPVERRAREGRGVHLAQHRGEAAGGGEPC